MLIDQANLHLQRGSVQQGKMFARGAAAEAERSFGLQHRAVDRSLATLGLVLRLAQRYPEAERELRRALAMKERTLGPNSPGVAHTLGNLAQVVAALGRQVEADVLTARAAAIHRSAKGVPGK